MRTASVVIGACFGDEGKGLMTDYLAGEADLVVRFNGGSQAGHTVITPEGLRHVFSHFGSGTLRGAPTFLSPYFVCNPVLFRQEREELLKLGVTPSVCISRRSKMTTPWDMMLNQFAEQARGENRHGSVGVGFGETIERCLRARFDTLHGFFAGRILSTWQTDLLNRIRNEWVPQRAADLGIKLSEEQLALVHDDGVFESFKDDLVYLFEHTERKMDEAVLAGARSIVFEGAQGLMLDQDAGHFPHVTRSHTGLANAEHLARLADIESLDVHYVTRCYLTRHGAGPLKNEIGTDLNGLTCETNVPNEWQGTMRYAPFDAHEVGRFIRNDYRLRMIRVRPHITMTCCDQMDAQVVSRNLLDLQNETGIYEGHMSLGPTRSTMLRMEMRRAA